MIRVLSYALWFTISCLVWQSYYWLQPRFHYGSGQNSFKVSPTWLMNISEMTSYIRSEFLVSVVVLFIQLNVYSIAFRRWNGYRFHSIEKRNFSSLGSSPASKNFRINNNDYNFLQKKKEKFGLLYIFFFLVMNQIFLKKTFSPNYSAAKKEQKKQFFDAL